MSLSLYLFLFSFLLFFIILIFSIKKGNTKPIIDKPKPKVLTLMVEKPVLIDAIIQFAGMVMQDENLSKTVVWKFSNYNQKHLNKLGYYCSSDARSCEITIYIRKHLFFENIIETVLHEMAHHQQYKKELQNFNRNYNKYSRKLGYDKNPYEIEARKFANKWIEPCINYLKENGVLELK